MADVLTIAPIAIDDLKKYFTDKDTKFIIDYANSTLRGQKLLTYLSNLDIPADISFKNSSVADVSELMEAYLTSTTLVNIRALELMITSILVHYKEVGVRDDFTRKNEEIIKKWINVLDSLTLYNMAIVNEESFKEFAKSFPEDDTENLEGVNFVSLLKNHEFYCFYEKIEKKTLKYYTHYFNDYMFKGKNMYSYWANENNPLFLLTYGVSEGLYKNVASV